MSESFKSLEEMMNRYAFIKSEAFDFPLCEEFFDRLTATLQTHELREKVNWKKYIELFEQSDGSLNVVFLTNGKIIGNIYREVDGYFVYHHNNEGGFWEQGHFGLIFALLYEMNKEWDEHVKKDLSNDGMTGDA